MTPFFKALEAADKSITLAINSANSPLSDQIWMVFSDKEIWYPMYILVAALMVWRLGWKKGLLAILAVILTIVACDQFANFTKEYFARFRPTRDNWMIMNGLHCPDGRGSRFGFYSAHAANSIGFAVCTVECLRNDRSHNYKWYGRLVVLWALLVGTSRIFMAMHFFGDVLTGFAIGTIFALIISRIYSRICYGTL